MVVVIVIWWLAYSTTCSVPQLFMSTDIISGVHIEELCCSILVLVQMYLMG